MADNSPTEIRTRVAANNIAWLQKELDSEKDKSRHEVLASLLAMELRRIADRIRD
jgi:hypothetical protein